MIAQYMPKYAQHLPNLSPKYAKDIFQICPRYAQKGKGGLSHHWSGAVYSGEYKFCQQRVDGSKEAAYWGESESGDSGYCRTLEHRDAVEHRREDNHLTEDKNINHFKFTLRI